jgi:hypothetical protein
MAFFCVKCKGCGSVQATTYFVSSILAESEMAAVREKSKTFNLTCKACGATGVYSFEDLGMVA